MSNEAAAAYAFGPFRLDQQAGELWRGEDRVEIRPKVFDLLVVLIQNRGKLLSKKILLDQVWSDVVVSEASLTRTVADLREVLGDDPDQPRYIQTSPKRGYKFVAPVEELEAASTAAGSATAFRLLHGTREYPLHEGEQLIGRGREVEIPLFTALTSRHHARIRVAGERVTVEDLGSMNGTLVNNRRVNGAVELKPGDQIEVGGERLVLWSPSAPTRPKDEAENGETR